MKKIAIDIGEVQEGFYFLVDGAPVQILSVNPLKVHKWDGCCEAEVKLKQLRPIKLTWNQVVECFGFIRDGWYIDDKGEAHKTTCTSKGWQHFLGKEKQKDGTYSQPIKLDSNFWGELTFASLDILYFHQLQQLLRVARNFKEVEFKYC